MTKLGETVRRVFERNVPTVSIKSDPSLQQQRALRRLLRRAGYTDFGRTFHFFDLLQAGESMTDRFRNTVPMHDYDSMYDPWWKRTMEGNEANVCWPGKIRYYALSSGTSGAPTKYIPVTTAMLKAMRRGGTRMFIHLSRFGVTAETYARPMLMLGGSTSLKNQNGYFLGDLSGINQSRLPLWLRPYHRPGRDIAAITDWHTRINEIARHAPDWDVGIVVGIPAWMQLTMEKIIETHGVESIHDIWPNLKVFIHGGVHFEPFRKHFEKLLKHPLIYIDSYLASEGFIGYQASPERPGMKLILNGGIFFEFIPFTDENFTGDGKLLPHAKSLLIHEVVENTDYALLISTCAGACRYLIGDTVRFTDAKNAEIIITGRTKHFLSICGEHLSVDNMNHGVLAVQNTYDADMAEYTVGAIPKGRFFAHRWYIGTDKPLSLEAVRTTLDEELKRINDDYATERSEVLSMEVRLIPNSVFIAYQEKMGKLGGQQKFPRVLKAEAFQAWEDFVAAQGQYMEA